MINGSADLSGLINALQNIGVQVGALNKTLNALLPNGAYTPISQTDAAASSNTVYYSTTTNKLSYKDFSNVSHALY